MKVPLPDVYLSLQMCPYMCGYRYHLISGRSKQSKYYDRDRLNDIDIVFYKDNISKVQPMSVIINMRLTNMIQKPNRAQY